MNKRDDLQIVLVDDDEAAIFLNTRLIQKVSPALTITSFTNPREALHYLINVDLLKQGSRYLIFLDINMPIMDGFEFLDRLQNSTYKPLDTAVIMLSSSTNSRDKEKAKDHIIYDYYPKPLNPDRLRNLFLAFPEPNTV